MKVNIKDKHVLVHFEQGFGEGNDIAWYKSIKPFQCPTSGEWETPVKNILEEIDKIRCKKIAEKIKGKI